MTNPMFSIIIPCRNEMQDIANTLNGCLSIEYKPKEIIVVDDSTDDTPTIISRYADKGVKLIHREVNSNGCCGARNVGMRMAKGDFIILLNSDDLPAPDLLRRLLQHFREGADYVVIQSIVGNCDNIWAKYIRAVELVGVANKEDQEWSEGFACRRTAAEAVGFIPGDFPVPFCRDWMFGAELGRAGYRKKVDYSIIMKHVAPHTLKTFWRNQIWRSTMWAPSAFYFKKKPISTIFMKESMKTGWRLVRGLLLLPNVLQAIRFSRLLSGNLNEMMPILFVRYVQDAAFTIGAFKGIMMLSKNKGQA